MNNQENKYDLIQFKDGEYTLDVNISPEEDTVWLTQHQISLLFEKSRSTITEHINNIFKDFELDMNQVCRKNRQTAGDGKVYDVQYYNLDVIIAVGYRVKSKRGIMFRKWANSILKQYLLNGYVTNSDRIIAYQANILQLEAN